MLNLIAIIFLLSVAFGISFLCMGIIRIEKHLQTISEDLKIMTNLCFRERK
jgi:hypothetical protein